MNLHGTVTLTGTSNALNLATALGTQQPIAGWVSIQPDPANGGAVYLGGAGSATLSTSVYGIRLEAPVGNVPSAPFLLERDASGLVKFSDWTVTGDNNDKIHVMLAPVT